MKEKCTEGKPAVNRLLFPSGAPDIILPADAHRPVAVLDHVVGGEMRGRGRNVPVGSAQISIFMTLQRRRLGNGSVRVF